MPHPDIEGGLLSSLSGCQSLCKLSSAHQLLAPGNWLLSGDQIDLDAISSVFYYSIVVVVIVVVIQDLM